MDNKSVKFLLGKLPPQLVIGAFLVGTVILLAIFGSHIVPYDPEQFHIKSRLSPPTLEHWMGTDRFGRDTFSRVLVGARATLTIALSSTLVGVLLGLPIGLIAGYFKGWVDETLMRLMDVLMSFPALLLAMLVVAILGTSGFNAALAVGLVFAPPIARVSRSVMLGLTSASFVAAARVRGESHCYVIVAELLPNIWPPIIVELCIRMTYAILASISLSYLGLGAQPPTAEWGLMIGSDRTLLLVAPWLTYAPAIAVVMLVIGVHLLGDGLRTWLSRNG